MKTEITIKNTKLILVEGDITAENVDAIVNAANSSLMGGGGVDGAIHRAGGPEIVEECELIVASQGRLKPGKAVITSGGRLRAKYVIHTVGPIWFGGNKEESSSLASCYRESLKIATDRKLRSIAFPAISTGVYGYPPEEAADIAVSTVEKYLKNNETSLEFIHFVLYDHYTYEIYASIMTRITEHI